MSDDDFPGGHRRAKRPKLHIVDRWIEIRNELAGRMADSVPGSEKRSDRFESHINSPAVGVIAALLTIAEVQ